MTLRRHKHTAITIHAIRQRSGVPYHVERKVCSNQAAGSGAAAAAKRTPARSSLLLRVPPLVSSRA